MNIYQYIKVELVVGETRRVKTEREFTAECSFHFTSHHLT